MSRDYHHQETYTHKSGKKYNVRWYYDHDMGSPLDESDCHGVVEELDWNPTNSEELEQHLLDEEPELEEETRLRMMRRLTYGRNRYSSEEKYYDVLSSLHKARLEWGITYQQKALEVVEKDFAYLKGWFDDDWCWLTVGVAPIIIDDDGDETIDEDLRSYCGGYESTILHDDDDNIKWRDEVINDKIIEVEWDVRKAAHPNQLELQLEI